MGGAWPKPHFALPRRGWGRLRIPKSGLEGDPPAFFLALSFQMPVCSYFLKGICSNSDCPYSHVYVSRKAEVCPDFLKGYCPLGEKVRARGSLRR